MFKVDNRIIIVDDNTSELETLSKAFLSNGIGCRPFEYDILYSNPLSEVRIAFFDINLTEKTVNNEVSTVDEAEKYNSGLYNDLASAIKQYIKLDNGPYALIFWTKNYLIVEGFKKYMKDPERGFSTTTCSPIHINYINKDEFIDKNEELSAKLLHLLNNNTIRLLFEFENMARIAGEKTINQIYKITPKDLNWGETDILFKNIDELFSKIAVTTLGLEHAKQNPAKAIFQGLMPILNYELSSQECDIKWESVLNSLYNAKKNSDIKFTNITYMNKVNTIFHIENDNSGSNTARGSVIKIKEEANLETYFKINNLEEWFKALIQFKKQEKATEIYSNSELIAVEISAACDYSQDKKRINKYILGFITPSFEKNLLNTKQPANSYHIGDTNFCTDTDSFQIWLNLNYAFSAVDTDEIFGRTFFVLKKEIMDMIGHKYANHISRIGITSF